MNVNNERFRQRVAAVSPLSGGVVFGKEEAWERLQDRMEKRPARTIKLFYPMSAAAVLFMVVIFSQFQKRKSAQDANGYAQAAVVIAAQPASVSPIYSETRGNYVLPDNKTQIHGHKRVAVIGGSKAAHSPLTDIPPAHDEVIVSDMQLVQTLSVALPKMKVVHINELDKSELQISSTAKAASTEHVNLNHLPVVHVSDVIREESEVNRILKESRLSFGPIRPISSFDGEANTTGIRAVQRDRQLQIKINLQN